MSSEEPEEPPARLQGSCSICFEDLRQSDKISALVCGHIYHHGCIAQWIAAKRQCPSCRRNVPKNGFVEKLFFDVQRLGGESEKPPEVDYREEHHKLATSLRVEKESNTRLETENKALKIEVKSLEKKVIKEKDKYRSDVTKLQGTITHLTYSSEETEYTKKELTDAKNKVKVSEFYKILTTHSDEAEKKLGEYLRKNGSLDTEKFFQLQKAQIKDLTDKRREAAREMEILKADNHSMKRKAQDDAAVIKALKQSVLELRERANVETPITNKRLRDVFDTETPPAAKRISMGFDDSSQLIENDLSFYKQQENKTPPAPATSKPSPSSITPFSFYDDDDDEYFRTPKLITKKVEIKKTKSVEQKSNVSDDSFDFDISVPKSIINRIPTSSFGNVLKVKPNIPTFSKQSSLKSQQPKLSTNSFDVDIILPQSIANRILTKSKETVSKPSEKHISSIEATMKRYQSADILPKKSIASQPSQKNARISSFFTRTSSSTSVGAAASKEYVTLD